MPTRMPCIKCSQTSFFVERYRSGHNGGASKASCLPKAGTWVRIPPSPPAIPFYSSYLEIEFLTRVCFVCFFRFLPLRGDP